MEFQIFNVLNGPLPYRGEDNAPILHRTRPMSDRKNHHFVPQFYFRRFSADGKSVCVITKATGKLIAHAPIKSQASKNNFYGSPEIENVLGEIEGECSATLRALTSLSDPSALDDEDVSRLLLYIALQRSRTMTARMNGQNFQDKLARLHLEVELNNSTEIDDNTKKVMLENLEHFIADPVQAQQLQMAVAIEAADALRDLHPIILDNKTNRPFVFGDAPVVFYNAYYSKVKLRGVLGFSTPGLLVFLPLSAEKCLMLVDLACYKINRVRNNRVQVREYRDVVALNKLQFHAASNCIYFGDVQYAQYLSEIWKQEQQRFREHAGIVVEAPGFDARSGEALGEIVHGFEQQLPIQFSLSIFQHAVLGDREYRFGRRDDR
jgi:hypothetical protein